MLNLDDMIMGVEVNGTGTEPRKIRVKFLAIAAAVPAPELTMPVTLAQELLKKLQEVL